MGLQYNYKAKYNAINIGGTMPREKEIKLDARIVVLTTQALKDDYTAYCEDIGQNPSDHSRKTWEAEVALWKAGKV
jgi:hypothetical protein